VWLDVEVYNLHVTPVTQVVETSSNAQSDLIEFVPSETLLRREDVPIEGSTGHELIYECPPIFIGAKPDEAHNIHIMEIVMLVRFILFQLFCKSFSLYNKACDIGYYTLSIYMCET
jgi:hypothetical protein